MSTARAGPRVYALGCKVSRIDAAALAAGCPAPRDDVLIVHTCTVTDRADRDGRKLIRRLRRENPAATLVVAGCLAQRDPDLLASMPEVDLVVGHDLRADLARLLELRDAGLVPGKIAWSTPRGDEPFASPRDGIPAELDASRTRAFLKLQDGCARRCAFCVIPGLRGPERSARPDAVVAEVRRLGERGVAEVVLAGVHLASYGRELGTSLLALLTRLEADPPACRVRLSSVEPMEAGEELALLVASSRAVVPHLHLPLQSGSDSVLRRMRRGITAARFSRLAHAALARNPRLHLATDLIAGFPGETGAEFDETLRFVSDLPFASLHVFPFSPRSGTEGARLHASSAVPSAVVAERARELRSLGAIKAAAFTKRAEGTRADVVVLRGGRALTDHYLDVRSEGEKAGSRFDALLLPAGRGELRARRVDSGAAPRIDFSPPNRDARTSGTAR